jgi:hypothetical protein
MLCGCADDNDDMFYDKDEVEAGAAAEREAMIDRLGNMLVGPEDILDEVGLSLPFLAFSLPLFLYLALFLSPPLFLRVHVRARARLRLGTWINVFLGPSARMHARVCVCGGGGGMRKCWQETMETAIGRWVLTKF